MADDLTPNGEREVFFELNGQMRSVFIQDKEARKASTLINKYCFNFYDFYPHSNIVLIPQEIHIHPKAQKGVKGQVGSPMPGSVIEVQVEVGQKVEKGAPLIVISAMKMEMVVQAPVAGTVKSIDIKPGMKVEGDDLLATIE